MGLGKHCKAPMAAPTPTEGVILLHGLSRSARSMQALERALSASGFVTVNVDYPSRQCEIDALCATAIDGALNSPRLGNCQRIHFVTHSMGGILVRAYLAKHSIPRLGRVVMLGPPNQGSEIVDKLRHWRLFQWVTGPAGQQLGTEAGSLPNTLGPVTFELGVIAGDRSIDWFGSALIPGKNDGRVSVERTRVQGMRAHCVLHTTHAFMMRSHQVIASSIRFLEAGNFEDPADLHPLASA